MNKSALICVCVGLLVLAAGLFATNKDLLLGENELTTGQTAENAGKEETATVVPTTEPATKTTTKAATQPTTAMPTTTRPKFTNPAFVAENITGAPSANAGTFTGYLPLTAVDFAVNDPDNSRGLPTSAINHSFGVAKDSKPHQISVDSQKFFETKGYNAITYDTKSTDKVLYLTFDCG